MYILMGSPTGDYTIAVDTVGAGAGETVLILDEGTGARQIVGETVAPIRALVVGSSTRSTRSRAGVSRPHATDRTIVVRPVASARRRTRR